jgi:hypothetical protein
VIERKGPVPDRYQHPSVLDARAASSSGQSRTDVPQQVRSPLVISDEEDLPEEPLTTPSTPAPAAGEKDPATSGSGGTPPAAPVSGEDPAAPASEHEADLQDPDSETLEVPRVEVPSTPSTSSVNMDTIRKAHEELGKLLASVSSGPPSSQPSEQGGLSHRAKEKVPPLPFRAEKCPLCAHMAPSFKALQRHYASSHLKENKFHCEQCGKGFQLKRNLNLHLKLHKVNQQVYLQCALRELLSTSLENPTINTRTPASVKKLLPLTSLLWHTIGTGILKRIYLPASFAKRASNQPPQPHHTRLFVLPIPGSQKRVSNVFIVPNYTSTTRMSKGT